MKIVSLEIIDGSIIETTTGTAVGHLLDAPVIAQSLPDDTFSFEQLNFELLCKTHAPWSIQIITKRTFADAAAGVKVLSMTMDDEPGTVMEVGEQINLAEMTVCLDTQADNTEV